MVGAVGAAGVVGLSFPRVGFRILSISGRWELGVEWPGSELAAAHCDACQTLKLTQGVATGLGTDTWQVEKANLGCINSRLT